MKANQTHYITNNLLPYDGDVIYLPAVFNEVESDTLFNALLQQIDWQHDEANMFGKHIITARKVAWYADTEIAYTYSKITKKALVWHPILISLKERIELLAKQSFNACLLNLYHNGKEGMAWHSDNEKTLDPNAPIVSVSFGARRKFSFKHKVDKNKIDIFLEKGSVLIMRGETQHHWWHKLPTTTKVQSARINLTFRKMI